MSKKTERPVCSVKRILVVEDDEILSHALYTLLTRRGYNVVRAFNGKEALEKAAGFRPEIILLDLVMPIMGGMEFLRRFKNESHIPIIIFSSLDSPADVHEALRLGATRYMLKSWATPDELFRAINEVVD